MRDDTLRRFGFLSAPLAALLWLLVAAPAFAQRPDDSYKGPTQGGGLDSQLRGMSPAPTTPGPRARDAAPAPGGGLQGRQTQGTIAPIPIAIPVFLGPDAKLAADVADVITADLDHSGLFRPLDRASFLEQVRDVNAAPRFPDWRSIQADALVVGNVGQGPDGRIIADQVYQQLTGEKGYFDTHVVFVDETGTKQQRVKRLAIMDQDGQNIRLLSKGQELVLTPRFSPTNQEITFMSYAGDQPRVFLLNLETGQRETVGEFPGMTFAPRFSPDGQRVIMSLQNGGNSAIYEMDLRSKQRRQLTPGNAIDTSPSYSPDSRQIAFETDRDGTQEIYVMNSDGSNPHRISGGDGRYATPVWSPRGDYIAFTKQLGGRFLIGVMRPDGSGERVLTEGFHNEGPTWAPNGRVIMFFRESPGAEGGPRIFSIDLTGYNERAIPTPSFASDPAWSPLLN